jgi:hypothetical protein
MNNEKKEKEMEGADKAYSYFLKKKFGSILPQRKKSLIFKVIIIKITQ